MRGVPQRFWQQDTCLPSSVTSRAIAEPIIKERKKKENLQFSVLVRMSVCERVCARVRVHPGQGLLSEREDAPHIASDVMV